MELENLNGILYRPGTSDLRMLKTVRHEYKLTIGPKDVVLDIGGNIGGFAVLAATEGAKKVVTIEPEPNCFKLLKRNTKGYANVIAINAALIPTKEEFVTLYTVDEDKSIARGDHCLIPTRGRVVKKVAAVNLDQILKLYKPSIIKMDCEGSEYALLEHRPLPSHVKQIAIEWHFRSVHPIERYKALEKKMMKRDSFKYVREYLPVTDKAWQIVRTYAR